MIKKYWKLIVIIILVLATAGGVYYKFYYQSEAAGQEVINPRMVVEVKKGSLEKTIAATGYVAPIEEKNLSFPTRSSGSTKIKKIYVEEGDRVEEGQLLMELDKTEAKLNYIKAQNAYNKAKINGSNSEIEEARLNLELAREELENMELTAPFDGVITDINVEEGGYYTSGTAATIIDNSRLEVEVSIEESDIPNVKLGQKAVVTLESLPGKVITGQVVEIADQAENNSSIVTLPVTVLLDNSDYDIKLGVSAELDIIVGKVENQVVVPITAVINQNGREFVIKVDDEGRQQLIPIKTGLSNGLKIAVESGLQPGDKIIVNTYQQALKEGIMPQPQANRPAGFMPGGGFGGMRGGRP